MNLDKYEKIDGREALKRLLDGGDVFMEMVSEIAKLKLSEDGLRFDIAGYESQVTYLTFNRIYTSKELYIPKPFDVRQAMLDRPNEWVGAIEEAGHWFKVGFDARSMRPRMAHMKIESEINVRDGRIFVIELEGPDACIPIEDVPEEATR